MDDNRQQIEEIRDKVDIYNLVAKYVKLKPQGRNFSGLCPFHQEKTGSFSVNSEMQRYKCFGCGEGGDIFSFIQKIENIDFPEALERLAKEAGVTLIKKGPKDSIYSKIEEMNKHAANFFYKKLKTSTEASNYIKDRNISEEMIKTFGIGYASGEGLKIELQNKMKVNPELLIKSGLFINKAGNFREKFIKRIIFPIRSARGKVIGFSGRILPNNKYGPKYLNSPKTPVFDKGSGVYGIYQSRQDIRKEDLCIFCEGQTDVISAHQHNVSNIVAPLGTAITVDQIKLAARITKNILFLFDSDSAGQTALERAFILSSELDVVPFAATPAPYTDIDELLQNEPKLLIKIIENKQDAFTQLIINRLEGKDLNNLSDHTDIVEYAKKILQKFTDPSTKNFYLSRASKVTGINMQGSTQVTPKEQYIQRTDSRETGKGIDLESHYLEILLSTKPLTIPTDHTFDLFTNKMIISILEKIKSGTTDLKELASENDTIAELLIKAESNEELLDTIQLDSIYNRMKKNSIMRQLRELRVKLSIAEENNDSKGIETLVNEISELTINLKIYK